MQKPRIATGSDHAGVDAKNAIVQMLKAEGYEVSDKGTFSSDSVDYPDFAHAVANAVEKGEADLGVLCCGSANGVAITANKHAGRQHHLHCNVFCLPALVIFRPYRHRYYHVKIYQQRYLSLQVRSDAMQI